MPGPGLLQIGDPAADVADEGIALPHHRIHQHRQPQPIGQRRRGLQRARIGRRDDPPDPRLEQRLRRLFRLFVAQRGQPRVLDPRILPGGGEVEIELALAVTQQDHAATP